jgi:hypothetical protein
MARCDPRRTGGAGAGAAGAGSGLPTGKAFHFAAPRKMKVALSFRGSEPTAESDRQQTGRCLTERRRLGLSLHFSCLMRTARVFCAPMPAHFQKLVVFISQLSNFCGQFSICIPKIRGCVMFHNSRALPWANSARAFSINQFIEFTSPEIRGDLLIPALVFKFVEPFPLAGKFLWR